MTAKHRKKSNTGPANWARTLKRIAWMVAELHGYGAVISWRDGAPKPPDPPVKDDGDQGGTSAIVDV